MWNMSVPGLQEVLELAEQPLTAKPKGGVVPGLPEASLKGPYGGLCADHAGDRVDPKSAEGLEAKMDNKVWQVPIKTTVPFFARAVDEGE